MALTSTAGDGGADVGQLLVVSKVGDPLGPGVSGTLVLGNVLRLSGGGALLDAPGIAEARNKRKQMQQPASAGAGGGF